jgi:hypothetical protein
LIAGDARLRAVGIFGAQLIEVADLREEVGDALLASATRRQASL